MHIKAIILDLDNTIYPVKSIGEQLFKEVFDRIEESNEYVGDISEIKSRMMKQPFQKVAEDFSFSEKLKAECLMLLAQLSYKEPMKPFDDYQAVHSLPSKKFLVTTGFAKMQNSKIKQLNLEKDFEKIIVVDPSQADLTKKDIFAKIIKDYSYKPDEVLVIGDDVESEIKYANELGMPSIHYNHNGEQPYSNDQKMITSFSELESYLA